MLAEVYGAGPRAGRRGARDAALERVGCHTVASCPARCPAASGSAPPSPAR